MSYTQQFGIYTKPKGEISSDHEYQYTLTYTDIAIKNIFQTEADKRGVEFKLKIETETERLLTMSELGVLEELLGLLQNPAEMNEALREFFDGYFGVEYIEQNQDKFIEETSFEEFKLAA